MSYPDMPTPQLKWDYPYSPYLESPQDKLKRMQNAALGSTTMPDPNSVMGPMPVAAAPPMSLWDRLQQVVSPAPTDGLLSEQDVKNARNQGLLGFGSALLAQSGPTDAAHRVTFGGAVGRAMQAGQGTYQDAVNAQRQAIQQKQAFDVNKLKLATMQQDTAQAAKAQAARNAVFAQFPPPAEDKDPNAVTAWIDHVTPALVAAQDFEGAEKLTALRKAMAEKNTTQQTQAGDMVTSFVPGKGFWDPKAIDPKTGKPGAWVPSIDRGIPQAKIDQEKAALEETRARTAAMLGIANDRQNTTLMRAFQSRQSVQDLVKRAMPINQALLSIQNAKGDATAVKLAMGSVVQAADQNARLQKGMMDYFGNLDGSIGGKWATLKARLLDGKLPLYQTQQLTHHLQTLLAQVGSEYDRQRVGEVKRHPSLDGYLPQKDEIFNAADSGVPAQPSMDDLWNGTAP